MPWYFYLAFKQLFPTGKRCSFFSIMSILGVTLGVMVLVIVLTVMNGFAEQIRRKIIETNGHIRIETGGIIDDYESIIQLAHQQPGVIEAAPYAQGLAMMQYENLPIFPYIRGVDLNRDEKVVPLDSYMLEGSLDDLDDQSILLGSGLANKLGATVGSTIQVYSPTMLEHLKEEELALPHDLKIAGIFESGWNPVDSNTAIVSLRLMQDLYGLGHGVHGVTVKLDLKHENQLEEITIHLNEELKEPLEAYTWYEMNRDFMFVLKLEKSMLCFIIIFIILVASFSIACSLMTTVVRKVREIGILGAIGARPWQIASCFCLQGLIIGVAGTVLGMLGGGVALYLRNDIIHLFARLTNSEAVLLRFYQFADIPAYYVASDFVLIIVLAIVISTLAGLLPAWRAAQLKPSEALRSE